MHNKNLCKRILLIFACSPFLIFFNSEMFSWCRTLYFIIPSTALSTYIILLNFPSLIKIAHSRPIYYEDLEDDRYVNPHIKKKYQNFFNIIIHFFITILISSLCYYYYDRLHNTALSKIELLGVFGGILSMASKIERVIGKTVLSILNKIKVKSPIIQNIDGTNIHTVEMKRIEI